MPSWDAKVLSLLRRALRIGFAFKKSSQEVAAITIISELGDLRRFDNPRKLMAFLGLIPSEHSSGEKRRQGSITKCGNSHARWMIIDCFTASAVS